MLHLLFFDDPQVTELRPLTDLRSAADLWLGSGALRSVLTAHYPLETTGGTLLVNSRVLFPKELASQVTLRDQDQAFVAEGKIIAIRLQDSLQQVPSYEEITQRAATLPQQEVQVRLAKRLWDYLNAHAERITSDSERFALGSHLGIVHPNATLLNPGAIFIAPRAVIEPGVVLNAEKGPILIAEGAAVRANTVVSGPAYIGESAEVNCLTHLRGPVTVGAHAKVGGEIAGSVIMPHTNDQHTGYTGRSYIGSWCNIAAGVITSNLKNTWGEIKAGQQGTGQDKLGALIGDYCMVGSGSVLSPGTVVGTFSTAQGVLPAELPAFSWFNQGSQQEYRREKVLEILRRIRTHAGSLVTTEEETALLTLFDETAVNRQS